MLEQRLTEANQQREDLVARHRNAEVSLRTEMETLKRKLGVVASEHESQIAMRLAKNESLMFDLSTSRATIDSLQRQNKDLQRQLDDVSNTGDKSIEALKAEVRGYQGAVKQLEDHIANDVTVKILKAEVESLKSTNANLSNQIVACNHAVSSMRVEADIGENARIQTLQDIVEGNLKKINGLEKEKRLCRPLVQSLFDLCEANGIGLPSSTAKEYETFTRYITAERVGTTTSSLNSSIAVIAAAQPNSPSSNSQPS